MKNWMSRGLFFVCAACSEGGTIQGKQEVPRSAGPPATVKIEGEAPMNRDGTAITPPDQLAVVEFAVPDALDNCSDGAAFPHDPAVDAATGLVYYTDTARHCIGQFNPQTLEFRAWPTATPSA